MNESGKELLGPRVLVIRIAPNSAYQTKDNQSVRTWASRKISYFKYWSLSDFHGFLFFENKIFTWLGSLIGKKVTTILHSLCMISVLLNFPDPSFSRNVKNWSNHILKSPQFHTPSVQYISSTQMFHTSFQPP